MVTNFPESQFLQSGDKDATTLGCCLASLCNCFEHSDKGDRKQADGCIGFLFLPPCPSTICQPISYSPPPTGAICKLFCGDFYIFPVLPCAFRNYSDHPEPSPLSRTPDTARVCKRNFFIYLCLCVYVCAKCVCSAHKVQTRVWDPPKQELQVIVSLKIKSKSYERAAGTLDC